MLIVPCVLYLSYICRIFVVYLSCPVLCAGSTEKALLSLLYEPTDYYATRLHSAFAGVGTKDNVVAQVLGGHVSSPPKPPFAQGPSIYDHVTFVRLCHLRTRLIFS